MTVHKVQLLGEILLASLDKYYIYPFETPIVTSVVSPFVLSNIIRTIARNLMWKVLMCQFLVAFAHIASPQELHLYFLIYSYGLRHVTVL